MCVVIILPTWQQKKKSLHQKKDFPVIPNTNKVRYMHDPISIYNNLVSDDVMEHTANSCTTIFTKLPYKIYWKQGYIQYVHTIKYYECVFLNRKGLLQMVFIESVQIKTIGKSLNIWHSLFHEYINVSLCYTCVLYPCKHFSKYLFRKMQTVSENSWIDDTFSWESAKLFLQDRGLNIALEYCSRTQGDTFFSEKVFLFPFI